MPDMKDVRRIVPWPARPAVLLGPVRYEIVRPAMLRGILDEAAAFVFAQQGLSEEARHHLFARVAAAAAVNALLD